MQGSWLWYLIQHYESLVHSYEPAEKYDVWIVD